MRFYPVGWKREIINLEELDMLTRLILAMITCVAFAGCTVIPRMTGDELPSGSLTGEKVCEVPQHWKALALTGVDTQKLQKATVIQVRIPPEWIGDALGWFVESDQDDRAMEHYPRSTWPALVIDQRGKQQFFPAVMKNPLTSPVSTVIIPEGVIPAGEEVTVYVLSGAYTKLLTMTGDMLRLPAGKDCLGLVDAEFVRMFPSQATVMSVDERLLGKIREDFPLVTKQDDGVYYSHSRLGFNEQVAGDMRRVRHGERMAEKGVHIAPLNPAGTGIGIGVTAMMTADDAYFGPFGERLYSASEAQTAFRHYLRGFNTLQEQLAVALDDTPARSANIRLEFTGRKSGWEIGEMAASQVLVLWETMDLLKARYLRALEKGGR